MNEQQPTPDEDDSQKTVVFKQPKHREVPASDEATHVFNTRAVTPADGPRINTVKTDPPAAPPADPPAHEDEPSANRWDPAYSDPTTPPPGEQPSYQQPSYQQPGYPSPDQQAPSYAPPPPPQWNQAPGQAPGWNQGTPYGAVPPAPGYYPQQPYQPRQMNTMAIAALVSAFVVAPLGIVFGHISLSQIKKTGEDGKGLALAGLIAGYVLTGLFIAMLLFWVIFIVWVSNEVPSYDRYDPYAMAAFASYSTFIPTSA